MKRYEVKKPVPNGYAYWNIIDTRSEICPNFAVASFAESMPFAEQFAETICESLNVNDATLQRLKRREKTV